MTSRARGDQNYSIHVAHSVAEFLDYLVPNSKHWKSAKRGDLAYRGQSSSCWPLTPKAFRKNEMIGFRVHSPAGHSVRVTRQARAEFDAVHDFVKTADASGLELPEPSGRILLQEEPRQIFDDHNWEYKWPRREVLETLALAQHHGVPTRLLDFTEDPMVAAYFAASSAWDSGQVQRIKGKGRQCMSVWVVDLRFVRAVNLIDSRYPERVGEVRVPRAKNSYLHAQSALFLIDRGANDVMARLRLLSIEDAIADRARFWHTGRRLAGKHLKALWFHELPIRQVTLCTIYADDVLRELEDRGFSRATLMPSLDRVVDSLKFSRSLAVVSTADEGGKGEVHRRFLRRFGQTP